MNYAQNSTFYHFFHKICRPQTKGVMFSDSKYNVLTIYINFIKNAATASFIIIQMYVGHGCIIKRPSSLPMGQDLDVIE